MKKTDGFGGLHHYYGKIGPLTILFIAYDVPIMGLRNFFVGGIDFPFLCSASVFACVIKGLLSKQGSLRKC